MGTTSNVRHEILEDFEEVLQRFKETAPEGGDTHLGVIAEVDPDHDHSTVAFIGMPYAEIRCWEDRTISLRHRGDGYDDEYWISEDRFLRLHLFTD